MNTTLNKIAATFAALALCIALAIIAVPLSHAEDAVQNDTAGLPDGSQGGGIQSDVLTSAVTSSFPDDTPAQPQAIPINKIPIYRAAKYQGGYFYTADLAEYKTAVNFDMRLESGPNGESPAFYATDASTPGALPVQRSAKLTGDGYFYTVSDYEHSITPQNNMRQETYTFYAMPAGSQMYDEIPMYRGAHLPNHGNGNEGYIYTADRYEYDSALPANGYRQESEVFRVFGDGGAVTPTPPAPADSGRLSSDNVTFSDTLTNYAGGDLIIREYTRIMAFDSDPAKNVITLVSSGRTSVTCTTTGQGYVANGGVASGNVPEIGCVIPKLASAGIYEVKVDVTDLGPEKVGELNYQALPTTFNANCGTMQAFGTNSECKTKLPQGQSILLQDTRGGADIGYGAGNYRVKKMPDDNVWQIDNLALDPSQKYADDPSDVYSEPLWKTGIQKVTCDDYDSPSYCDDSLDTVPQWTDGAYDEAGYASADHSYGYLYNWCAATADISADCATSKNLTSGDMPNSLAPTGWKLPIGDDVITDKSFYNLAAAMETEAKTNGNPVYNPDKPSIYEGQQNWRNATLANDGFDALAPFQGVYSGNYGNYVDGLGVQGIGGSCWSSTVGYGGGTYDLGFGSNIVVAGSGNDGKNVSFAVRAVL